MSVAILLVLDLAVGEQLALVGLFNTLLPTLLLPAFVFAALGLLRRRWGLALAQVPAIVAFVAYYGILFIPQQTAVDPNARQLSVLTYNLHAEWAQYDPIVALIREADADVVALQELGSPAAKVFAEQLADVYPYQALHPQDADFIWGQGVLSRYPIIEDTYVHTTFGQQRVVLDVDGRRVAMYNMHPPPPFSRTPAGYIYDPQQRSADLTIALDQASTETGPVILAGDFNMTDRTDDYARVAARFHDTFREVGWGLGFTLPDYSHPQAFAFAVRLPAWLKLPWLPVPLLTRIDFVFHDESFDSVEAKVWPTSGGSDHRPVLARLAFPSQ